jgi:trehalose/maltose hydrolase-like predicted phosphorylase
MDGWKLVYEGWDPESEPLREALTTLGNGYFATRGAMELVNAGGAHYPGTYVAGGYNRLDTELAGRVIENEDLVNWPNWLYLTFRPEGGDWFAVEAVEMLEYRHELDLQTGIMERIGRFVDSEGRETSLRSRRIVHMADMHLAAIEWTLTPENWSGRVELKSALDGTVKNEGVERYRQLNSQHLEPLENAPVDGEGIYLLVQTVQSRLEMAQAARTRVFKGTESLELERQTDQMPGYIEERLSFECEQGQPLRSVRPATRPAGRSRGSVRSMTSTARTGWLGSGSGTAAISSSRGQRQPSSRSASISSTCCRPCRPTPSSWTSACRPAVFTARPTAATSSGTSCTSSRSCNSASPRSRAPC